MFGIHPASAAERQKVEQMIGPVEERGVPLRTALQAILDKAKTPASVDVCNPMLDMPVTIVTELPTKLGTLVLGAGMQLGAAVILFQGEHGEAARPRLFCPGHEQSGFSRLTSNSGKGGP
jgi:hypothetical protein